MKYFTKSIILLSILFCFSAKAQTNVSGTISTNTTWTKANSPYIVTDTVIVNNATLTIEPGVIVKFNDSTVLKVKYSNLIANGTSTDSITFTSNSPTPFPGIWKGIRISDYYQTYLRYQTYTFNYCNISYGQFGCDINFAPMSSLDSSFDVIKIRNCSFMNNSDEGLSLNGPIDTLIEIDSCNFSYNPQFPLYLNSPASVHHCYFSNNGDGILIAGQSSSVIANEIDIDYCNFENNSGGAIGVENPLSNLLNISHCRMHKCGTGIDDGNSMWLFNSNMHISYCSIDSATAGINITSDNDNSTIDNCRIFNNTWGIIVGNNSCSGYENCTIHNNILENNFGGITINEDSIPPIHCNKFNNNTSYSISQVQAVCSPLHSIDASDNFWSTTDTSVISGFIDDGNDHPGNAGIIYFFPIDSSQCYLSNCNLIVSASATNATCVSCNDGSATANVLNGFAPYLFTWNTTPVQTTQTAVGLATGTYSVCVTDQFGCSACSNVTVNSGNCSALFNLIPDTIPQHYLAINMASGAAPLTYMWNWGDGSPVSTLPFPNHTYASAGLYTICLSIADINGCSNTYCNSFYLQKTNAMIYVSVVPPTPTGINELNRESFSLYPNPTTGNVFIKSGKNIDKLRVQVSDITGKIISESSYQNISQVEIELHQPPGIYFFNLLTDKESSVMKVVKL